jgi:hypothetical protein
LCRQCPHNLRLGSVEGYVLIVLTARGTRAGESGCGPTELLTDAERRVVHDLAMPWDSCALPRAGLFPDAVLAALAEKPAAVAQQMLEQISTLHAASPGTRDTRELAVKIK